MKSSNRGRAPAPPTADLNEVQQQDATLEFFRSVFPQGDADSFELGMRLLRLTQQMRYEQETQIHRPPNVSIAQVRMFMVLASTGPTTPGELARFTHVSPASVSSVMRTMLREGYVTRKELGEGGDGRVRMIELTPKGLDVLLGVMRESQKVEKRWADAIPADVRRRLLEVVREVTEHLLPDAGQNEFAPTRREAAGTGAKQAEAGVEAAGEATAERAALAEEPVSPA